MAVEFDREKSKTDEVVWVNPCQGNETAPKPDVLTAWEMLQLDIDRPRQREMFIFFGKPTYIAICF